MMNWFWVIPCILILIFSAVWIFGERLRVRRLANLHRETDRLCTELGKLKCKVKEEMKDD